jgi:hypothetical protein
VLVAIAAYVALYVALTDLSRARAVATHSLQEVNVARDVRRLLIDMETGQRGFIITGEPRFLEQWEIGRRTLPESVATLRRIVDDPRQAKRAEQLETDSPCLHQGLRGTAGGCCTPRRGLGARNPGERGWGTSNGLAAGPAGRLRHN